MSTSPHQNSSSDMNRTTQSNERRQQTDRRRGNSRRETDRQHPEQYLQLEIESNAQTEEQSGNTARNRRKISNNRPVVQALSEDEIRFLLDDN